MAVKDRPGLVRLESQPAYTRRRPNAVQEFLRTSKVKAKPVKPQVQRGLFD